ncbi:MAG: sugar ABC transporter permease [Lachnospiraceae bacterium]|nr:sugar ABC transporter permease [Lachnospiraceae bacterium]
MKTRATKKQIDRRFIAFMVLIPLAVYLIFFLIPCFAGLLFGFTDFGGYSLDIKWVGLYNYQKIFGDAAFRKAVVNHLKLYLGTVIFCFPIALMSAIALTKNKALKESKFYRILFFFPTTVPMLIIAILWMVIYNPSFGVFNTLLTSLGLQAVPWLSNSKVVMWSVLLIVIWRQLGFYLVYFMAGVTNIPQDIYEAALIDGANDLQQTFRITIPLTWDVITTAMLFYIESSVTLGFNVIYIVTRGGPDNASEILSSYMFKMITDNLDYGKSSAVGAIMLLLTLGMAAIILLVFRRESYEY